MNKKPQQSVKKSLEKLQWLQIKRKKCIFLIKKTNFLIHAFFPLLIKACFF